MRNLTVVRQKSIVGSWVKAKLYITATAKQTLIINKHDFDKVGELKNNSTITISIPSDEIYFIAGYDKFYNYSYLIPAGDEDLCLYMKPKLNPFKGNPMIISDKPI